MVCGSYSCASIGALHRIAALGTKICTVTLCKTTEFRAPKYCLVTDGILTLTHTAKRVKMLFFSQSCGSHGLAKSIVIFQSHSHERLWITSVGWPIPASENSSNRPISTNDSFERLYKLWGCTITRKKKPRTLQFLEFGLVRAQTKFAGNQKLLPAGSTLVHPFCRLQ